MTNTVEDTIKKLRLHLGAENDVELGRKLRIAKSTISSWRARGTIPDRYLKILDGDSHQMVLVPMNRWSEHEWMSFNLALFRFVRATADLATKSDYRSNLDFFRQRHLISFLVNDSQKELSEFVGERKYDARTAFALMLHKELEQGEEAIERTRAKLRKWAISGKSVL